MTKVEEINGMCFVEQTTFYVYRSKKDRNEDKAMIITSDKETYEKYKKHIRNNKVNDKLN